MILESILPVIGHAGAVKEFVEGGALAVMLQEIGGIEVDAAILCIKNMAQSQNPLREVELAVGHLQSAHFAFQKLYQGMNFVNASFHEVRIRRTIAKVQEINVLMAICYSYLSEPVLMKESIKRAADACEWMIEKWKLRKLRVGFEVHGLSGCNPMRANTAACYGLKISRQFRHNLRVSRLLHNKGRLKAQLNKPRPGLAFCARVAARNTK
jgi:hypothetical protein